MKIYLYEGFFLHNKARELDRCETEVDEPLNSEFLKSQWIFFNKKTDLLDCYST